MPRAATAPAAANTSQDAPRTPQTDTTSDWTGADYDSYQNLAASGALDPTGVVTAARAPRRTA